MMKKQCTLYADTRSSDFSSQPNYDVSILLTIVLVILTIILIFAFRYKCKSNRTWVSGSFSFLGL